MKNLLSLLLLLTAIRVAYSQPINDNFTNAYDVTALLNGCSANALYTTVGATPDGPAGSCWNNSGPLFNVWFRVTAPASGQINVTVNRGGVFGTQSRTQLALWEDDGTTQLACNRYVNNGDNVTVGHTALVPGNTYYISVDVYSSGYRGTFTLCLSDEVDYDYYEGAADVTGLVNSCSANAQYTTVGATPDGLVGSCWNNSGPLYNRWFKFTAPSSGQINVTVNRGGVFGTQSRTQLALWESDGTTQLACNRYVADGDNVTVGHTSLIPGNTYYISVDVYSSGYRGTFTLCLSDEVDYDYYEGATDVTAILNGCSADAQYTTVGATPDGPVGSCWNNSGPLYNRWFKFTAPASGQINITVNRGGGLGTQSRTQLALWESDGTTQLACNRYIADGDNVTVGHTSLIPGNTYYISVDVYSSGYRGTFTLCLQDEVDYDYYEGAADVTGLVNSCSANAQYTTSGATPDGPVGSCWNNSGPLYNRWFKFTAPASGQINITVNRGGGLGTQSRTQLALWESDGTTQLACNRYVADGDNVTVGHTSLIPGNTYYISVDVNSANYRGTFTLCLQDEVDYDYYEGAVDVTDIMNSCSINAQYTTAGATPDGPVGSCWNNSGPLYNRWFKFTAPASGQINVTVNRGGVFGTQSRTQLALWESDGTTQLACNRYVADGDNVTVGHTSLIPGNTYYISVDVNSANYRGTFTLCLLDEVDYDYYEGATDVTGLVNGCSADAQYTTSGATPDGPVGSCWNNSGPLYNRWFRFTAPASGQINITVNRGGALGTQRRTQLALWESDGTTQLACNRYVADGDNVTVGHTSLIPGNTYYISVDVNSANYRGTFTLCLQDEVDYDYYEGATDVTSILNGCSADAQYTTAGATPDGPVGSCWNNSGPLYNRWFKFTAPASGQINVTVNRGGVLGTQSRTQLALWESDGTTQLACNRYVADGDNVSVGHASLIPGNTYYISVDVNSANYRGSFTLCLEDEVDYDYYEGALEVSSLINGCSLPAAYTTTGGTPDGIAGSCWNNSGPRYNRWFKFVATTSGMTVRVDIGAGNGTQGRTQAAIWQDDGTTMVACSRYTTDGSDVEVVAGGLVPGNTYYISVDAHSSGWRGSFSLCLDEFVLLPVQLIGFQVKKENSQVMIDWQTLSEKNNAFFTIERSVDMKEWQTVGSVSGKINSSSLTGYSFVDASPVAGQSYYRLKQTDLDGASSHSEVQAVLFSKALSLMVAPNPVTDELTVTGDFTTLSSVHIFNQQGQEQTGKYIVKSSAEHSIVMEVQYLSPGLYFLRINSEYIPFIKE